MKPGQAQDGDVGSFFFFFSVLMLMLFRSMIKTQEMWEGYSFAGWLV